MRTHCTAQGTRVCCTAQLSAARWPEREANPREGVHVNRADSLCRTAETNTTL